MFYPRVAKERLVRLAAHFPAVVVTGARQAGKTTLMRDTFPDHHYVSLDLPTTAAQAERNSDLFLAHHPAPVLIDEVQYAPGLFRHLKSAIDEERHAMGRYVLTGSQHFTLMKGVSESLAGRCGILELENLSLHEIGSLSGIGADARSLAGLMARGQFPELWRVPGFPAADFFAAYLAAYLERDVRQILNVVSLRDFERFIRILAARSASLLNKSDIARDVGVAVKTIGDWLSVLQASGQIVLLEPWYVNFGKRLVKTPKVYFCDTGLLCFLLNLDASTLLSSPSLGAVWETFVFAELRKLNAARRSPGNFWYYRDQRGVEVDFVLDSGGELSFMECKWEEEPDPRAARGLLRVSAELASSRIPWRPAAHYVIGRPASAHTLADGVTAVAVRDLPAILAATPPSG